MRAFFFIHGESRVLLKTDSGYPRDAGVFFHHRDDGKPWEFPPLWHPLVSSTSLRLTRSGGPERMSQSPVSCNSNIERRMDRPKAVVGVIRGVA